MLLQARTALALFVLASHADAFCPGLAPGRCAAPRLVVMSTAEAGVDELIGKLRKLPAAQMQPLLADNIKQIDQRFFLRLAEMSDVAVDDGERDAISELASTVSQLVEDLLRRADERLDDDAGKVQGLLRILASEAGQFELPIPEARMANLRAELRAKGASLDETFVATVKAYMGKADADQMDGLISVLRTLLQTYASERLLYLVQDSTASDPPLAAALRAVLESTPDRWDAVMRAQLTGEGAECSADALIALLQDKMGEVVLGMPSGSAVQSVLAEYLNELLQAVRALAAEEA